jgi:tRNA A37 threonylcarbamoyladenosine dehydratase
MDAKNISQDSQHKEKSEGSTMSALKEKVILETVESLKKHSLHSSDAFWSTVFIRHKGFFTNKEQRELRYSTVAIAGLGAVGGTVFLDLVRAGVGSFIIADADIFEPSNLNRQHGAYPSTFGRK